MGVHQFTASLRHKVLAGALVLIAALPVSACADESSVLRSSYPSLTAAEPEAAPELAMTFDDKGRLWMAYLSGDSVEVSYSDDMGQSFSPPVVVSETGEMVEANGGYQPRISAGGGRIYVSWDQSAPLRRSPNIRFVVSMDGGIRFSSPVTVNTNPDPGTMSQRFAVVSAVADGL